MIDKEAKKIKTLVYVCIGLVAIGGANIAFGIGDGGWISIASGLFCIVVSSWSIMRNIKTLEVYAAMEEKEKQIFRGLD